MGVELSPREGELYKRCDEILHYIWDPIGVAGETGARDEYRPYLPEVFALVRDNAEPGRIAAYLAGIEVERMGLRVDSERDRAVVRLLLEWREFIWENI